MFVLTGLGDVALFAAGFAACWFGKDAIVKFATGAENFAKSLEAKAAGIRATLAAAKV